MVRKLTKTRYFYIEPFLTTREQLHLLEISRILKENHSTTRNYLNKFEKQGLLKKQEKGKLTLYSLNFDSPLLIDFLVLAEKEKLTKKMQENSVFKELIYDLHKQTNKTTLMFGSATKDFNKSNDIDILSLDKNLDVKFLEKKFNLEIHFNYVNSLKNLTKTMKQEILKKHLIINNSEEVVKWLL